MPLNLHKSPKPKRTFRITDVSPPKSPKVPSVPRPNKPKRTFRIIDIN